MFVTGGATDVTTYFKLRLTATGLEATGLTITDLDLQYTRSGATPVAKVDATALAAANTAHTDNYAFEIDSTDQPGVYRVDWPDAAFVAGVKEVILTVKHASCFSEDLRVLIDPPVNVTKWLGTACATPTVAGVPEVDVTHWAGAVQYTEGNTGFNLAMIGAVGVGEWQTGDTLASQWTTRHANWTTWIDYLSSGAMTASNFGADCLTADKFADDCFVAANFGDDCFVAANFGDGFIVAASFAAGAIDAAAIAADAGVEIAAAVWDRVLTGATHNITNSAGRRLRQLGAASIFGGTASAGSSNSITLAGGSATNEIYDNNMVVIVGGTGEGQTRVIVEYNGTSKVAIVDHNWEVNPDNTSEFEILASHQAEIADHGLATAGGATSITLATTASAVDDCYVGSHIYISTSTGTGQTRLITAYNGTSKVATVSPAWVTNPTSASVYKILPVGRSIVDSFSATAVDSIWDELMAELTTDPGATPKMRELLSLLYMKHKNAETSTATAATIKNNAGTTVLTSTLSDDATTFTKGKYS